MRFTSETAKANGQKGGRKTKRLHGLLFYSKNGKKGVRKQRAMKRLSLQEGR